MSVDIGYPAPDFTLVDEGGEQVTLSALRGRNVVLIFYPFDFSRICTKELHDVTGISDQLEDALVFGVSVDSKYAHAAFKRSEGLSARLLADFEPKGEVARLYDAYVDQVGAATRATFVIDAEGIVRYTVLNPIGEARNQEELIEALAACRI